MASLGADLEFSSRLLRIVNPARVTGLPNAAKHKPLPQPSNTNLSPSNATR